MLLLTIIDRIITFAKMPPKQMLHLRTLSFDDICWFYQILGDKRIEKTVIPQPSNQQSPPGDENSHPLLEHEHLIRIQVSCRTVQTARFWFRTCALKKTIHQHLTNSHTFCFLLFKPFFFKDSETVGGVTCGRHLFLKEICLIHKEIPLIHHASWPWPQVLSPNSPRLKGPWLCETWSPGKTHRRHVTV